MSYNLSWLNTTNNLGDFMTNMATVTDQTVFVLSFVAIWIALFIAFKNYNTIAALMLTNFSSAIIAVLMWFAGLLPWYVVIVPIVLLVASIIIDWFGG